MQRRYPAGLPRRFRWHWRKPWRFYARRSPGFRRWLGRHGYLTPNFTLREAGGQDRNPLGTSVPRDLRGRARNHAFRLEKLRHRLGDRPMWILSWYRNQRHNAAVGGVRDSKHLRAIATDFSKAYIDAVGRARFDREANRLFANGGFGHYPSGSAHVDSRGWRARW